MPGSRYVQLAERAADTFGYLTAADARDLGVSVGTLNALSRRGQLDRVGRGIYRVPLIPPSRLDQYKLATIWPDGRGMISHESALNLCAVSDVNPDRIHVTVPLGYRTHREIPGLYVLHHETVLDRDVTSFEGIPVVTLAKAIRQLHHQHVRPSLLTQAIEEGLRDGWLRKHEATALRDELRAGPA
jgi:predicted transcriptional regulator of viral defense system